MCIRDSHAVERAQERRLAATRRPDECDNLVFRHLERDIKQGQMCIRDRLTVYPTDAPCLLGAKQEFLSASRLDNMTSVYACLEGILHGKSADGIQCIALFDNEEVGSCTKQGADSMALPNILMRLYSSLGYGPVSYTHLDVYKRQRHTR